MEPIYRMLLTDRERVCVYPDQTCYALEDVIGEEYGVIVLGGGRNITGVYGDVHDVERAVRELADKFYRGSSNGWWDKRNRAIHLYLNLSGFDSVIHTLQGYSQGDWAEVVVLRKRSYGNTSNIVDVVSYVNAWFAGDIYSVIHEKLDTYVNLEDTEDTIERWNEIDAIHCVMMFDVRAELPVLASVEFGIPRADWKII